MSTHNALALSLLATLLSASAAAQTVLHTHVESETQAAAGDAVAIWDDLDGDGALEWVVGVPKKNGVGSESGQVRVFSGATHAILFTLDGALADSRLGASLANVGDLDGDGSDELAVGAPGERRVYVYSGTDASLSWTADAPADAEFGHRVAAAGDVNGDDVLDVAVSAFGVAIHTLSGDTGASIWRTPMTVYRGWSLAGVGDVDGDDRDDLITGAAVFFGGWDQDTEVLSGADGSVIRPHSAPVWMFGGQYGWSVTGLGDLDGDGFGEYAVGDPTDSSFAGGQGYVAVYSGASGTQLDQLTFSGWDEVGSALANAGDVDADGFDDLIVGDAIGRNVYVYSVVREELLYSYTTDSPFNIGVSATGVRDVNGDGWPEALVGAGNITFSGPSTPGGAVLLTLGCPPDAVYPYCTAVANSTGQRAAMAWQNTTSIANNDFRLSATKCPADKPGLFFYGTTPTELPIGEGHLCVTGATYRLPVVSTGPTGTPSHTVDFTSPPNPAGQISAGETWYFSFWFRDPTGGPAGFNFANGLRATFCP